MRKFLTFFVFLLIPSLVAAQNPITVGTTPVNSGTSGAILYDNAGVLGNIPTTGSGSVVLANNPTLTGKIIAGFGSGNLSIGNGDTFGPSATGANNLGIGAAALSSLTSGSYNACVGIQSCFSLQTGSFDTAFGESVLLRDIAGLNVGVGYAALQNNTLGTQNVAVGFEALFANTTGNYNIGIGTRVLTSATTATQNTCIGQGTCEFITTSSYNTAIGAGTMTYTTTGAENTAVGQSTLTYNTTGTGNSAFGNNTLIFNTTGAANAAYGSGALYANTTGNYNSAMGPLALYRLGSGSNNVAVGYSAGFNVTNGSNNTIIGAGSTSLPATLNNAVVITTGDGTNRLDYNYTNPGLLTAPEGIQINGAATAASMTVNSFTMPTGAQAGYVLTSDGQGRASWQAPPVPAIATTAQVKQSPGAASTGASGVAGSGDANTPGNAIYRATSTANGSAITGDGNGIGAAGITGRSFGFNGTAITGYNGATGNAGYFYMDSPNIPSAKAPDTANSVVYAKSMAGSTSAPGYYGHAGSFVTANPANQSATLYAENQADQGVAVMGDAKGGGYAAYFKAAGGICSFGNAPGWSCGLNRTWLQDPSETVDPGQILRQLAQLPVAYYTRNGELAHYLGPSAEAFNAAFGFGQETEMVNNFNAQGVAFAAIQGLYQELEKRDQKIADLEARLAQIERRIAAGESQAFLAPSRTP